MTSTIADPTTPTPGHRQPYYRLDAMFTDIVPVGPVADGLRMNGHFAGTLTADGPVHGGRLTGVDYFRLRSDGVGVIDAYEVITVGGSTVEARVQGYLLPPDGAPQPTMQEITSPGFQWPDVDHRIEALATFATAAPDLAELNATAVVHSGTVNFATGVITVLAHRIG